MRSISGGASAASAFPARDGHRRPLRRSDPARRRSFLRRVEELPPDEEAGRKDEHDDRDPRVQPQPCEVVRRVDPQQLLEEAAERVEAHVQREERRRLEAEATVEKQQDADHREVVDELVEERRVERRVLDVVDRPVLGVDLEPPRQGRRLAEELLVPPVADAPDALREEEARRNGVHEAEDAVARSLDDDRAGDTAEEDPAPNAEAALPHRERSPPRVERLHLRPGGDVVVEPRADDPEADAPDGDAEDEVPVAAALHPAYAREPDAA